MSTMPFQALRTLALGALPIQQASPLERPSILLAIQTVPLLRDDLLKSLFSAYRVELFQDTPHLFPVRDCPVVFALLCGAAGVSRLTLEAHTIRKQWPLARILMLGKPPQHLEDHLYDETVIEDCSPAMLQAALDTRPVDFWTYRADAHGGREKDSKLPAESDPTKAGASNLSQPLLPPPRDLPADEQQYIFRVDTRCALAF